MNSHGIEISIAGGVVERVRDPTLRCFFSFSFLLDHTFIVFRYKELSAALAMERTKPINQKLVTKETLIYKFLRVLETFSKPTMETFNKTTITWVITNYINKHNLQNNNIT